LVRDATDDAVERPQTTPQPKELQLRKSQLTRPQPRHLHWSSMPQMTQLSMRFRHLRWAEVSSLLQCWHESRSKEKECGSKAPHPVKHPQDGIAPHPVAHPQDGIAPHPVAHPQLKRLQLTRLQLRHLHRSRMPQMTQLRAEEAADTAAAQTSLQLEDCS
jgi:hypothetical protein